MAKYKRTASGRQIIPDSVKEKMVKDINDGYTYQSVADFYGVSVGTVYQACQKAKRQAKNRRGRTRRAA